MVRQYISVLYTQGSAMIILIQLLNNCLTKQKQEVLTPLLVPEGLVFRPRKQDVEQLKQRDFLGKAKVECLYGGCLVGCIVRCVFVLSTAVKIQQNWSHCPFLKYQAGEQSQSGYLTQGSRSTKIPKN